MRKLASRGGKASGKARRWKKVAKTLELPEVPVELAKRPNLSGGSHDNDWLCPGCHHRNSLKRRMCAECGTPAPLNGRITRKALRERAAEHRIKATLRRHSL